MRALSLSPLLLAAALSAAAASSSQLPSVRAESEYAQAIQAHAKWWINVDDRMYYAPPASLSELSHNVSNYYYGLGSDSALTEEMRKHRVGGEGRWHIFHLPQGPSMLQIQSCGDRRAAFSSLVQLQHGEVLGNFPEYPTKSGYTYPAQGNKELELKAASSITPDTWEKFLVDIINLPGGGEDTRSWTNPTASAKTETFLIEQFKKMGLKKTCLQEWNQGSQSRLANVVAVLPGTSTDTLTVGAHYDSRPFNGKAPGAEDNGSGVATLLSVAKALMDAGVKPQRTIYFVGFAAEEPGLFGSKEFARGLQGQGTPIACSPASSSFLQAGKMGRRRMKTTTPEHAAIILDEVGWPSPNLAKKTVNLESKDWTTKIMNELAQANLDHNGQDMYVIHNNQPFGSDHMSFLDREMPAVLVINGDDEKYPEYHQEGDQYFTTPDRAASNIVKKDYAAQIARMVLGGAVRIAGIQK